MTAENLLAWLGEASLVLGFVVLLVLLARFAGRERVSATWRYALWLAVPAALLATLAPAGLVDLKVAPPAERAQPNRTAPEWIELSIVAWQEAGEQARLEAASTSRAPAEAGDGAESAPDRALDIAGAILAGVRFPSFIVAAWLVGLAGMLAAQLIAEARFRRAIVAGARRPLDGELAALDVAASDTPFVAARDFRLSARLASPIAFGLFRPIVLLPEGFLSDYSLEEQRIMVLHEAEHVRAGHLPQRFAAQALRAVFWFHPLAWLAGRAFVADQELAADQGALAADTVIRPQTYAATLLKAAERMSQGGPVPAGGVPLICAGRLKERTMMLARHASLSHTRPAGAKALTAVGAAAVLAGLAGCVSLSAKDAASRFAAIAPGASRADIEAAAGTPDYVLPGLNVVVYTSDDRGVPMFIGCTVGRSSRRLDVVKYDESEVVESVWWTPGEFITVPDGDFERWTRRGWVSAAETPVRGVIAPGALRADVIAAAGEPYYVMPAYNIAVYTDDTPKNTIGCGIGVTSPRRYVIQYDENDVVTRTEIFGSMDFARRLDAWAAEEAEEASIAAPDLRSFTENEPGAPAPGFRLQASDAAQEISSPWARNETCERARTVAKLEDEDFVLACGVRFPPIAPRYQHNDIVIRTLAATDVDNESAG